MKNDSQPSTKGLISHKPKNNGTTLGRHLFSPLLFIFNQKIILLPKTISRTTITLASKANTIIFLHIKGRYV